MKSNQKQKDLIQSRRAILKRSSGGAALLPEDRLLLDLAKKRYLNEKGEAAVFALHKSILEDRYHCWFHGIRHLTIDVMGYVYWKGHLVECYRPKWAQTKTASKYANEIARRCRVLEKKGIVCDLRTVVVEWKESTILKNKN